MTCLCQRLSICGDCEATEERTLAQWSRAPLLRRLRALRGTRYREFALLRMERDPMRGLVSRKARAEYAVSSMFLALLPEERETVVGEL